MLLHARMSMHPKRDAWKWHFHGVFWILVLTNPLPSALGLFLGDIKAVLNDCEDNWTLQERAALPVSMTVCINIRVVAPGPWIAFTYSSVQGLKPELGLEGDEEALFVWLLRVRHRFPLKLTERDWHQVCLQRNVLSSSLSLEVDNQVVGHRVVIAQASPSYGSLWLGCGQREQAATPAPGQVELYLFRVWADLEQHRLCEDGSVIGWSSRHWRVTDTKAQKRDNSLPCALIGIDFKGELALEEKGLNCHIDKFCSNPYFWIPVSVESEEEILSEKDIQAFISRVFTCEGEGKRAASTRSDFDIFCLNITHLQVKNVSCSIREYKSQAQCGILLQLSSVVSVCKLRQAALSALQQTTERDRMKATVTGAVERVGQNVCDGLDPSSGGFVTCSSSLLLEEMCLSRSQESESESDTLTCKILAPKYVLNKTITTDVCPNEETHFCNCKSFCEEQNHFYAQKLDVTNINNDTKFLPKLLKHLLNCGDKQNSQCNNPFNIPNHSLKKTCVNCQKINGSSYSCMVLLEMKKTITDCSDITDLQTLINNAGGVTTKGSLTPMVVCGDYDKTKTLLTSDLTWFTSNLNKSDICDGSQTHLKCASNEKLAVLLYDPCQSDPTITSPSKTTTRAPSTTSTTTTTQPTAKTTQAISTTTTPTTTTTTTTTTQPTAKTTQAISTTTATTSTPTTTTAAGSTTPKQASVQTLVTTPYTTLLNITNSLTLNTKVTTQHSSTQPEATTSKSANTISVTTLEITSTETSQDNKATLTKSQTKLETTAKTKSSTKEVRSPTTASTVDKTTTLPISSDNTTASKETRSSRPISTTASTVDHTTTGNSIDTKTNSTILNNTTKATIPNANETTTANSVDNTDNVSRTTNQIETAAGSIRPATNNTTANISTISNTFPTRATAETVDTTTIKESALSNTTSNEFSNSTLANSVETMSTNVTTASTLDHTSANSINRATASAILVKTTKVPTTSATILKTNEATTANKNTGNTDNVRRTTNPIETAAGRIRPETNNTTANISTISKTFPTRATAETVDTTTIKESAPSNTTSNEFSNSTLANSAETTSTDVTTASTLDHTSANSINRATASVTTAILVKTTKVTTTSATILKTNEATTANKNMDNTDNVSRTTNPIETTAASIRPETNNTTATDTTTIKESVPSNTASNGFSNSTLANSVGKTSTNASHTSTIANTVENTSDVKIAEETTMPNTIYTSTAATITSNTHNKANITSSTSNYTTTVANILNETTEISTATTATMVDNATAKTYQTSSSQTMVNVTSTSDTTNALNVISTVETTAKTLSTRSTIKTTPTPFSSTDSQPSTTFTNITNFNETTKDTTTPVLYSASTQQTTNVEATTLSESIKTSVPGAPATNKTNANDTLRSIIPQNKTGVNTTTLASPITSTSNLDTTNTSLPSTITDKTTTKAVNALVSEATTFATTKVTEDNATTTQTSTPKQTTKYTTTSVPYSAATQQMAVTSLSESTKTTTGTTRQASSHQTTAEAIKHVNQTTTHNVTTPTTPVPTSKGSLVDSQTTIGNVSMTNSPTPSPITVSIVTPNTTHTQRSTLASSTVSSTSTVKYNVTTGIANLTTTTSIPAVSVVYNATTSGDKTLDNATLGTVTTPYTSVYNATKGKHETNTTTATMSYITTTTTTTATTTNTTNTTTFTPITNHTTGYKVTKALYNKTRKYNVSTTSVPLLNTTMPSHFTTVDVKNTSSIHTTATTSVHNTPGMTSTPLIDTTASTQASVVPQSTTRATTASPALNFTTNLSTPSMKNMTMNAILKGTTSSPSSPAPTSSETIASTTDNTTTSTAKPQVTTVEVSTPAAVLPSQSTTIPTTNTVAAATTGPQQTKESTSTTTTITTETSRTSRQTSTTLGTTDPDTGFVPTSTAAQTTKSQQELEQEANNLLSQTKDVSQLNASQVSKLVGQLESLLDGPSVSKAVAEKAINIISNLMEGDAKALSASANRLVRLVDNLGLKLEVTGENEILSSTSLVLAVQTVDASRFSTTTANIFNTNNVQINGRRSRSTGAPLGSVFLPVSLTEGLSPEEQHWASRVQFTFYTKSTLFMDKTVNNQTVVSPVLASSVANVSISSLKEDIEFTIRNINPMTMNHSTLCAFWDFTENGGDGGWNNAGCFVIRATAEDTTCSCNHLTSFAVLLDLSREGIMDRKQAQILSFITYIGCGVSVLFLSVTILTYLSFEKLLRDIPAKILVQLCIALLLLNLVFMLDGWLAGFSVNGLCISTAFFLHYFLLASFTWAGLEALHMYLSIVRVFTPYLSKYMMKFSIMGWGIPLIVVIIIIAVDKNNYGLVSYGKYTDGTTDDFCWLRNDLAFYIGVLAYFLLIFTFCLIIFVVVLVQLARIKRQNPQNKSPNRGVLADLRSISGLVILLGFTWGFALFAWGPLYLPFVYLFSIFNSLQGFFVFVLHCAVKENVQRQWRMYLCCGKLRLPENSGWSGTATHNHMKTSLSTMSTSGARLASSSASVVSETNSSGSVYADSGISDGSNCDVVMNEIHRRNMALQGPH